MKFRLPWGRKASSEPTFLQLIGMPEGNVPQINDTNYATAYASSAWVFACVSSIASAVGSVDLRVLKSVGEDWDFDTNNDLAKLLSYVNADINPVELLELTAGWLGLMGNAYWHLLRTSPGAPPSAIRVLPADLVEVKVGKGIRSSTVAGYEIKSADRPFLPDIDVIHFRSFSVDPVYGIPPIKPLEPVINLFSALTRYKYAVIKSGGLVPAVLKFSKPMITDDERNKFNLMWSMWRGADNEGKPLLIGSEMEYNAVGTDPDKLMGLALSHEARETICGLYGVPPGVVGLLQDANYSNLRVQRKSFWTETVIPKYLRRIEGGLNEQLAWQFEKSTQRYRVDLDTSGIEALQEDLKEKASTNAILIKSGQRTPNEVRVADGLEPLPGGDVLLLGSNGISNVPGGA